MALRSGHASRGDQMRELNVGDQVDQYELSDVLARSGMATIFKAVDAETGARVVLKVPYIQ